MEDPNKIRKARAFHQIAWGIILIVAVLIPAVIALQPAVLARGLSVMGTVIGLCLVLLYVNRRGYTDLASWLLVGGLTARVTLNALYQGGIHSPGVGLLLVFVVMAGLLLGEKGALVTASVSALITLSLAAAEATGNLPEQTIHYGPYAAWALTTLYMGLVIILARMAVRSIREELDERLRTERRLGLALAAGRVGVWDQDVKSGVFYGDERAYSYFGRVPPPARTMSLEDWKACLHPEDVAKTTAALRRIAETGYSAAASYRVTLPDGRYRSMDAIGTAIIDDAGAATRVVMNVTERRLEALEREQLLFDHEVRLRELTALQKASSLLLDPALETAALLIELAPLLPPAFQFPAVARARVSFAGIAAQSDEFRQTPWMLRQTFTTRNGDSGAIEVAYLSEQPAQDEGHFTEGERRLLETLAGMLRTRLRR